MDAELLKSHAKSGTETGSLAFVSDAKESNLWRGMVFERGAVRKLRLDLCWINSLISLNLKTPENRLF